MAAEVKKPVEMTQIPELGEGNINHLSATSKEVDNALSTYQQLGTYEYTQEEEKAVLRKIDLWMMPTMALSFGLYAVDKNAISYAALFDLVQDNHLAGQQYSLLTTLFFLGFLVWEYPAQYIAQKLPIAKFLTVNLFLWGVIMLLMPACHDFGGLAALRFLMGMCECSVQPLFMLLIGMFYTRKEQASRTCIFYGFNGLSGLLGGPMAYAVGSLHTGFPRWKIFFLTLGAWTLLWSIFVFIVLPDSPTTARFKTDKERYIALDRVRRNQTGIKNSTVKRYQIIEAFRDPAVWILVVWVGAAVQTNISGSFQSLVIKGLGFTKLQTALLTMPPGGIQVFGTLIAAVLVHRFPDRRALVIGVLVFLALIGAILLEALPQSQKWPRLVGVWLLPGIAVAFPVMLSYTASNIAGYTKKVVSSSLIFIFWCTGNIIAPQLFLSTEAPIYGTGLRDMLVACCVVEIATVALFFLYWNRNRNRDAEQRNTVAEIVENEEFLDRTDFEIRSFRYVY